MQPPTTSEMQAMCPDIEAMDAIEQIMVGGNHLASYLVGNLGGDFATHYPPDAKVSKVRKALSANDYDVWCCWAAIMRARSILDANAN